MNTNKSRIYNEIKAATRDAWHKYVNAVRPIAYMGLGSKRLFRAMNYHMKVLGLDKDAEKLAYERLSILKDNESIVQNAIQQIDLQTRALYTLVHGQDPRGNPEEVRLGETVEFHNIYWDQAVKVAGEWHRSGRMNSNTEEFKVVAIDVDGIEGRVCIESEEDEDEAIEITLPGHTIRQHAWIINRHFRWSGRESTWQLLEGCNTNH